MTRSENIGQLAKALATAQGGFRNASKDHTNPFFKSKYADMASVYEACRYELSKAAIAVIQPARAEGAVVYVTTLLAHESGEWIAEEMSATAKDAGPQALASCITMLRRYGLSSMVGVAGAEEDDDGNAATFHAPPAKPKPKAPVETPPAHTPSKGVAAPAIPPASPVQPSGGTASPPEGGPLDPLPHADADAFIADCKEHGIFFQEVVKGALGERRPSKDWKRGDLPVLRAELKRHIAEREAGE